MLSISLCIYLNNMYIFNLLLNIQYKKNEIQCHHFVKGKMVIETRIPEDRISMNLE